MSKVIKSPIKFGFTKYFFFPTANLCAKSAASAFVQQQWRWGGPGPPPKKSPQDFIPSEAHIRHTLLWMQDTCARHRREYPDEEYGAMEGGRLAFHLKYGYGHEV